MSGQRHIESYLYDAYEIESGQSKVVCSGTAACVLAVLGVVDSISSPKVLRNNKINILLGKGMFDGINDKIWESFVHNGRVTVSEVDPFDLKKDCDNLHKSYSKFYDDPTVILFESYIVPECKVLDFDAVAHIKSHFKGDFWLIINNTMLTEVALNPFNYGANIVVQSLGKWHSSGPGRCIGAITYKDKKRPNGTCPTTPLAIVSRMGIRTDESVCHDVSKNLGFVQTKMNSCYAGALNFVDYLKKCSNVSRIRYTQFDKYLNFNGDRALGPGVVYFDIGIKSTMHNRNIVNVYLNGVIQACRFVDNHQPASYGGNNCQLRMVDCLGDPNSIEMKFAAGSATSSYDFHSLILYLEENMGPILELNSCENFD